MWTFTLKNYDPSPKTLTSFQMPPHPPLPKAPFFITSHFLGGN